MARAPGNPIEDMRVAILQAVCDENTMNRTVVAGPRAR
jgi:hypothetical protein